MLTVRFTAWDGTQPVRLSVDRAFGELAACLTRHDGVAQALDWLLRNGLALDDGRIMGLDDLVERFREERRRRYGAYRLDHALDELRRRVAEMLDLERAALADRPADDQRARAKRRTLDRLPPGLGDALEQLARYDFESPAAREAFDRLAGQLDALRELEAFQRRHGESFQGPQAADFEAARALMRAFLADQRIEDDLLAGNLDAVDLDALASLLGVRLVQDVSALRQLPELLASAGYLTWRAGRVRLSAKGARRIGQLALRDIYRDLLRDRAGHHASDHRGLGEIRPDATKPYAPGDPLHLDAVGTLRNALARGGPPLRLHPDDFAIFDSAHATTTSTVLLLDMSWSMSWEGRFTAAKKVALAMATLVRSRYPRDYFGIVGFYTRAAEIPLRDLPDATWNMGDPFTNLQDGLRLAGDLLRRHPSANPWIIVITDGQPTAYFARGRLFCDWPLSFGGISARAAQETLREVERLTRRGVVINTFMLDDSPTLRAFVERMTRINKGRALFTRPDRLGKYVLVDYIARKRKRV